MSASLTATWVEQNQCPLHQSILLTQGPIHEIIMKKYWELAELENEGFLRRPFWIFKSAILNFFFASSHWKIKPIYMRYHFFLHYGWFLQNLGKEAVRTFMHTTVCLWFFCEKIRVWIPSGMQSNDGIMKRSFWWNFFPFAYFEFQQEGSKRLYNTWVWNYK